MYSLVINAAGVAEPAVPTAFRHPGAAARGAARRSSAVELCAILRSDPARTGRAASLGEIEARTRLSFALIRAKARRSYRTLFIINVLLSSFISQMTTIPTLDFAAFLKDEGAIIGEEPTVGQARVASQINDACKDHGFVFIRNLGLPDGLREKTFEASRGLFDLDDQYKRDNLCRSNPETNAGYAPFGSESTNKSRPADLKEAFNTRLPALGLTDFSGTPEGYKETATSFWAALEVAMDRYAIAIATALGLPFDYFKGKLQKKNLC
eukprot:4908535-Pleurochrysis_carterae.AAC.1